MLFWNEDKTTVEKSVFLERLEKVMKNDEWIIDGNYSSTMEQRMMECDTVFFLDYATDLCLDGIKERKGKPRSDMPWIEEEDDLEFIEFIKSYNEKSRPQVIELLERYSEKNIYIFSNREEEKEFLSELKNK